MYVPSHFEESRIDVLHEFARSHPFASLVTVGSEGPCVNHLPFHLAPKPTPLGTLQGHVARSNPLWRDLAQGGAAIVVFQGPHAYVSPSWYPSKQVHGKVVPTWNYAVTHAHGTPRAVEDAAWLRALLNNLTDAQESTLAVPWKVDDAPRDFTDKMMEAIVGIEIPVTRWVGKWKVSQNRAATDRLGVVAGLESKQDPGAAAMADLVRERA